MANYKNVRPMTEKEKEFASDNYNLIMRFLKMEKQNAEELFDVVIFGYLLSVQIYLNNTELQREQKFETVSYMYMKRDLYRYYREQKAQKRSTENGTDISYDEIDIFLECDKSSENLKSLEYAETLERIARELTEEQQEIFKQKLDGYSIREIAENLSIKEKRAYKQFAKVKEIVATVMELSA